MEDIKLTTTSNTSIGAITNPPTTIIFRVRDDEELLRLEPNGDIYCRGKLVENDKEVVDGLRDFLNGIGYNRLNN